jgi:pimeloyl-ACP methyl ester carboxylesterase
LDRAPGGGSDSDRPFPSKDQIAQRLHEVGPSGSDPRPYLEQLRIPALWLYGTADREVPVAQSLAVLNSIKAQGRNFTIVTFPGAGHGLLDSPPTDPRAPTTFVEWVLKWVQAEAPKGS